MTGLLPLTISNHEHQDERAISPSGRCLNRITAEVVSSAPLLRDRGYLE